MAGMEEEKDEEKEERIDWNEDGHRRSGRSAGKPQVDYTTQSLDRLIRAASKPQLTLSQKKKVTAKDRAAAARRDEDDGEGEEDEETAEGDAEEQDEAMAEETGGADAEEEDAEEPLDSEQERWRREVKEKVPLPALPSHFEHTPHCCPTHPPPSSSVSLVV